LAAKVSVKTEMFLASRFSQKLIILYIFEPDSDTIARLELASISQCFAEIKRHYPELKFIIPLSEG